MGYYRAGLDVVGVDIKAQPRYPFEFHQADALEFVRSHGRQFDLVHASPPCQASSLMSKGTNRGRAYVQLVPETQAVLIRTRRPYVIENVLGAPIRNDLMLCGEMFGLAVIRHRYFEIDGWEATQPDHPPHRGRVAGFRHGEWFTGPYWAVYGRGGGKGCIADWQRAMGIDWTGNRRELAEAIPPAYTRYVGAEFRRWSRGR